MSADFLPMRSPLLQGAKPQGSQGDGGRMDLGCLAVGSLQTAEAIKPTGANGEGGVEFTGVFCVGFFLLTSI